MALGDHTLEPAKIEDLAVCAALMDEGRAFQRQQGFVQWTEDYPNRDTVKADIHRQTGYVLKSGGEIAGYLCVDFDGDPAYDEIKGRWGAEEPYAVVHRMAFSGAFRGRGLADVAFGLVGALCLTRNVKHIRIDTDASNRRMQHILVKNGFVYRGTVLFQGSEKLAYDKAL